MNHLYYQPPKRKAEEANMSEEAKRLRVSENPSIYEPEIDQFDNLPGPASMLNLPNFVPQEPLGLDIDNTSILPPWDIITQGLPEPEVDGTLISSWPAMPHVLPDAPRMDPEMARSWPVNPQIPPATETNSSLTPLFGSPMPQILPGSHNDNASSPPFGSAMPQVIPASNVDNTLLSFDELMIPPVSEEPHINDLLETFDTDVMFPGSSNVFDNTESMALASHGTHQNLPGTQSNEGIGPEGKPLAVYFPRGKRVFASLHVPDDSKLHMFCFSSKHNIVREFRFPSTLIENINWSVRTHIDTINDWRTRKYQLTDLEVQETVEAGEPRIPAWLPEEDLWFELFYHLSIAEAYRRPLAIVPYSIMLQAFNHLFVGKVLLNSKGNEYPPREERTLRALIMRTTRACKDLKRILARWTDENLVTIFLPDITLQTIHEFQELKTRRGMLGPLEDTDKTVWRAFFSQYLRGKYLKCGTGSTLIPLDSPPAPKRARPCFLYPPQV